MNFFRLVAQMKNFGQRSMSYLSYVNSLLIISTFLSVKEYHISMFVLLPVLVLVVSIIGYIDYRFILAEELKHINTRNNIKHDLEKIKKKLEIE